MAPCYCYLLGGGRAAIFPRGPGSHIASQSPWCCEGGAFLLTAYNMTRDWKEAGSAQGAEDEIMLRRLFASCNGGLDADADTAESQ
jgi:hypothetical protein